MQISQLTTVLVSSPTLVSDGKCKDDVYDHMQDVLESPFSGLHNGITNYNVDYDNHNDVGNRASNKAGIRKQPVCLLLYNRAAKSLCQTNESGRDVSGCGGKGAEGIGAP
ncbi:hypothetical protein AAHC03_013123 [Spirometra sp. Aus1]